MRKLKVYLAFNLDGTNLALVAAHNLPEAASLMKTTVGELRRYGYRVTTDSELVALATGKTGTVFYKPMCDYQNKFPWREGRYRDAEVRTG